MGNTLTNYSDDNLTREALTKAGSERTLHEIYGLFYGSLAAPDPADPAEHVPVIFDDEDASQVSEEDAENVRDNLLSLWNFIARWKPEKDPFYFPEQEYPATLSGRAAAPDRRSGVGAVLHSGAQSGRNGRRRFFRRCRRCDARTYGGVGTIGEKYRRVRGIGPEGSG